MAVLQEYLLRFGRPLEFYTDLEKEYLPEWETKFTVVAACADDAHRALGKQQDLAAILSELEQHVITNDYTIRHDSKIFQIVREDVRPRMRKAPVRVETRRHGRVAVRFEGQYLRIEERQPAAKTATKVAAPAAGKKAQPGRKSQWMSGFWDRPAPSMNKAIRISNATS